MSDERSETSPKGADDLIRDALPKHLTASPPTGEAQILWDALADLQSHDKALRAERDRLRERAEAVLNAKGATAVDEAMERLAEVLDAQGGEDE